MDALDPTTTTPQLGYCDKLVIARRPRCPACGAIEAKTTRSFDNGDGSRTQRKRCKVCNLPFTILWE